MGQCPSLGSGLDHPLKGSGRGLLALCRLLAPPIPPAVKGQSHVQGKRNFPDSHADGLSE
jgi:hypothetical protein